MLYNIILVLHVIVAVALVVLVLLQQGKGADAGAAFGGGGGGASGTMFGSRGAANFLTRTTAVLAFLFFGLSLALFTLAGDISKSESIVDEAEQRSQESTVPAAPEDAEDGAPEDDAPVDVP
ncbi:MAG: preprotein translocase subunit SecG, partial [Thiohalophilus sp.]